MIIQLLLGTLVTFLPGILFTWKLKLGLLERIALGFASSFILLVFLGFLLTPFQMITPIMVWSLLILISLLLLVKNYVT